jgi:hypothetical protein
MGSPELVRRVEDPPRAGRMYLSQGRPTEAIRQEGVTLDTSSRARRAGSIQAEVGRAGPGVEGG